MSDPGVIAPVGAWQRAAIGYAAVRQLKLARFGDNMRNVAVTEGDKVEAEIRFGVSVNTCGVNDLVAAVDQIGDAEVDALISEYGDLYDVAPELSVGAGRRESLRYGARIEAGLRAFLTDGGFGAFTTNFEDLGGLRQLPGLAVQRLMAVGYGFGGEGDWKASVMLHTIKAIGQGRPGGTSFMEDYTYELGEGRQKILGAHMLEVCPTIAGDRPRIEIHPLGIGNREDPVRLVSPPRAGRPRGAGSVTWATDSGWCSTRSTVSSRTEPLPKLPVARAVWEPRPSLATSAECWLIAGGPHHTVLSKAVGTEELTDFAEMVGTELLVIDADTTRRSFADEIRWNGRTIASGWAFDRLRQWLPTVTREWGVGDELLLDVRFTRADPRVDAVRGCWRRSAARSSTAWRPATTPASGWTRSSSTRATRRPSSVRRTCWGRNHHPRPRLRRP